MGGSGAPSMNQRAEDPQCPMKRIWCFVGNKNVWANIQPDDDPVNLNFNLDDDTCWAPFLKPGDPEEEEMETEHCIEALKDDDDGAAQKRRKGKKSGSDREDRDAPNTDLMYSKPLT